MSSILKYFFLICFTVIIYNSLYCQENNYISARGTQIIDLEGKPILLKGINLGNWLVPEGYFIKFEQISSPTRIYNFFNTLIGPSEARKFWNEYRENYIKINDIKKIKELGFNSIRIPFHYSMFFDEDNNKLEGIGYALLDRLVEWCKIESLYVLLDMHCAPGGQTGDNIDDSFGYPFLFDSIEDQKNTIAIWKKLASIYANEPIILGYDFLNEPIAHYFDKEKLNPKLEPFFKQLTEEIRTVDKNHLFFIAGAQWNSDFSVFGAPFDSKLVYTFHKYWSSTTQDVIQNYIDYSNKYEVPIYLGESGENTNQWIKEFRSVLEKNNIGWCFWPYKKMDSDRCVVSINRTTEFDSIISFANSKSISYEEIRNNRPNSQIINKALTDYLENMKLNNCKINYEYLEALGLKNKQ
ncbi:MAG: cellulase family glycosylhydrolase [bacterium]